MIYKYFYDPKENKMNKKLISIVALILCIIFAGGCFGTGNAVQTKKELTTIEEIMASDDYKSYVTLAKFSDISYNFDGVSASAVNAKAVESLPESRFADAAVCKAGDKITVDFTCKFGSIELAKKENFEFILGSGTMAAEIEAAIIEKALEKGKETEFKVTEKLDLGLSAPVERELNIKMKVNAIKHCDPTEDELKNAETLLSEEKKKELSWNAYLNICKIKTWTQTVLDAIKESKRKSDSYFASSYGKDVTAAELTGITADKYEEVVSAFADKKYSEDLISAILIKDNSKICTLTAEEKEQAIKDYAEILGVETSKLSESDKTQVEDQLKKEKIKQYIYDQTKK